MSRVRTSRYALSLIAVTACAAPDQKVEPVRAPVPAETSARTSVRAAPPAGIFITASPLPYEMPEFDKITNASYRAAFAAGIAEQRKEVEAIANAREPPSFENTIVALERSGRILYRVSNVFFNLQSANTNPELDAIETEVAPKLAQHQDAIFLNPKLFERVRSLQREASGLHLDPESGQLLARTYLNFVRSGAQCTDAQKDRLRQLNSQLASLTTQFQQNVLKATNSGAVVVDDVALLAGLSAEQVGAAASAAKARGLVSKWLIVLQNTTTQPALVELRSRALRERIYRAAVARSAGGDADNTALVLQIVALRAERAKILGYPSYAAYALDDETAGTTTAVNEMLSLLAIPAIAKAKQEARDIQALIDQQARATHSASFELEPWDWAFYSEQLRRARYAYDEQQTRPYFELNHVLKDGVFFAATALYGLTFKELKGLPVYQPDVRVFEVFDADGSALGLFIADYYARDNKQGGAWENQYVDQSRLLGTKPVVANHVNIPKPAAGQPTLLTFDEVTALFHEFGHAIHALLSNVKYQSLSGTNTPPDFVEYPSQYNEMWASDPTVLANYARNYETGEPMPKPLLAKVLAASKFDQGFLTSEYLAAAILDQAWHQTPPAALADLTHAPAEVMAFEAAALQHAGVDFAPVPPRYHTPYFSHIFSGGYAAGYYAYLWADVLARDTESWMRAHGGLKRDNGDLLRAKVLSRGRSRDPLASFEDFYGRAPDIQPLLDKRGLVLGKK